MNKAFKEHAKAQGADPKELLAFYRGLGPSPKKLDSMAEMIETIAENTDQCSICGFQAQSKSGLTRHMKTHEEES